MPSAGYKNQWNGCASRRIRIAGAGIRYALSPVDDRMAGQLCVCHVSNQACIGTPGRPLRINSGPGTLTSRPEVVARMLVA